MLVYKIFPTFLAQESVIIKILQSTDLLLRQRAHNQMPKQSYYLGQNDLDCCPEPQASLATLTGKTSDFAKPTYPCFNFTGSQVHVSTHCHKSLLLNKYPRQRQNQALSTSCLSATGFESLVHQLVSSLGLALKTIELLSSSGCGMRQRKMKNNDGNTLCLKQDCMPHPSRKTQKCVFRISVGMQRYRLRFCRCCRHAKSSKLSLEPFSLAAAKYRQPSH